MPLDIASGNSHWGVGEKKLRRMCGSGEGLKSRPDWQRSPCFGTTGPILMKPSPFYRENRCRFALYNDWLTKWSKLDQNY